MMSSRFGQGSDDLHRSSENPQEFDIEGAFKVPREHRYLNISVLWIFYYTKVVRILYRLGVRHEAVTLSSLAAGIGAGMFLMKPGYGSLVAAALLIHLKDVLDASDGSLARLKGQTNRIARFLDSLCDFVVVTWLITALALRYRGEAGSMAWILAGAAWISVFLQCSYFNYYLVKYVKLFGKTNVRTDESMTEDDKRIYTKRWKLGLLFLLQNLYRFVYGWQDRLVAGLDGWSRRRALGEDRNGAEAHTQWYAAKSLMTMNSPLCFGTHLFVLIVSALLYHPEYFYYIVVFAGNFYLLLNVACRHFMFKRLARARP